MINFMFSFATPADQPRISTARLYLHSGIVFAQVLNRVEHRLTQGSCAATKERDMTYGPPSLAWRLATLYPRMSRCLCGHFKRNRNWHNLLGFCTCTTQGDSPMRKFLEQHASSISRVEAAAIQLLLWLPFANRTGGFFAFGSLGTSFDLCRPLRPRRVYRLLTPW